MSEQWQRITELFHEAKALSPGERSAFLQAQCAGDEAVKQGVLKLLLAKMPSQYLEAPAIEEEIKLIQETYEAPPPLRQLAHYEIIAPLGAGGMGEVWLAQNTRFSPPRQVAIKTLPLHFTQDPDRLRRFINEANAASSLNHPNIITVHDIGQETTEAGTVHYIATEYIEGETLRARMNSAEPMPVPEALGIASQIAAALSAAHHANIIHRDIKPENVMLRPDGIIKLLDFGLAKLTESDESGMVKDEGTPLSHPSSFRLHPSTTPGLVVGTPRYMSPEQARGEKVDKRTDIFSLGVVLYEMVTGRAPFAGETANETIAAVLRDAPLPLTTASAELERIINRALRKESADRYQTAGDLLADLKELKEQHELQAKRGATAFVVQPSSGSSRQPSLPSEGGTAHVRKPLEVATSRLRALVAKVWPSRPPVLTEKDEILLADFENKTGDPVFDGTLKQGLAIQLRQSPFLRLLPEESVRHTLRLMKRPADERITTRIAHEICVRHNLKALIASSIVALGSHYVITLEAIHGQNGQVLETEQVEAKSKEQVLRALSQAAARLRAKLGESLSSLQQYNKEMEETTTQRLEAFQAYSLGYEQTLNGRILEAITLYRRAVELDPDFAFAWSMLSIHHSHGGQPELAGVYAAKAYALRERVSDYEQMQITCRYHYNFTGDIDKALEAATPFKRIYPRTSTAPINLLTAYDVIGRHEQAVVEGYEAMRLNPNFSPTYWFLGRALLRVSRFAEAKEIFQQALDQKFDVTLIHAALYQMAFAAGDTAALHEQLAWVKGRPDEYAALEWQAGAAAYAGQWRKAQELARRAIELAAHGMTKELAARYATELALRAAALGDYPQAAAIAAQGLTIERGRAVLPRAALALALSGAANQAEPLIDELRQRYPEDTAIHSIWLPTIRAALLLRSENGAALALDQLQATTSYEAAGDFWPQTLRGQAHLKLQRGAEAALEFQKIIDQRGQSPLSPLYPLAYLGLARALALTGAAAKSRQAWAEFSLAWQAPDADLPLLIEAKREFDMT